MARIWMPLPDRDFDVTEVAVPWKLLTSQKHSVVFVTEDGGSAPTSDPTLLTNLIVIQILWFVLSHHYASLRYNRPETWRNTLQAMTRPGIWFRAR